MYCLNVLRYLEHIHNYINLQPSDTRKEDLNSTKIQLFDFVFQGHGGGVPGDEEPPGPEVVPRELERHLAQLDGLRQGRQRGEAQRGRVEDCLRSRVSFEDDNIF